LLEIKKVTGVYGVHLLGALFALLCYKIAFNNLNENAFGVFVFFLLLSGIISTFFHMKDDVIEL